MRRNLACGISLSILIVLAGLDLASAAPAMTTHKGRGHRATSAGTNQSADTQTVGALQTALKLLTVADHDYDGHRAKAAHEVHQALVEMHPHYHHNTSSASSTKVLSAAQKKAVAQKKTANGGPPAVHEDQTTSDSQLRQAQQLLQGASTGLNANHSTVATHSTAAKHSKTGNHPKAAAHVAAAIAEINTALAIK